MPRQVTSALLAVPLSLALVTSACGRDSAFAETLRNRSVRGTYLYAGKGQTASIPWAFDAKLVFDGRGKYRLDLDVNVKNEPEHETDQGTYRVEGDRVFIRGDNPNDDEHELRMSGDSLVADLGWKGMTFLRLAGVPKPVFVKKR
jgi:hypothetical protein